MQRWDAVQVMVTFPARVTAGRMSVIDFHVFLGGKPLDLSTVGPRDSRLRPTIMFHQGHKSVTATAQRTLRRGFYRVRVVLPSTGAWSYRFKYDGLVRSYPRLVAR